MALIVQKFGGTSVGTPDRIKNVAARALATQAAGNDVVVIVSAMSGETNRLLKLASDLTSLPDSREVDALAATGEQVTAALTAIAIQAIGGKARSFLGHQLKVLTDNAFTKARIKAIDATRVMETISAGTIAVVAGFQGVDEDGNITTLGRGGSDTSAVAIAAAIGAAACEIYTDVDGVYTTDPNICKTARKIERISYEEMLELASLGAKVLQIRSVEVAMKYGVPVHVRSSFSDAPGTWVVGEESSLESISVTGVAYDKGEVRVMLVGVDDKPGVVAHIFSTLADENISVDMIIQNAPSDAPSSRGNSGGPEAKTDVTFTATKADLPKVKQVIGRIADQVSALGIRYDEDIAKVSIVGLGMRSHAGVAAKMFKILSDEGINIQAISTSEIKISCLVATKYMQIAADVQDKIFQALADPSRRAIFESLSRGEAAVKDLTSRFDISQPAVSQHLNALKDAGLVHGRRQGRMVYYRVEPHGLKPLIDWIAHYRAFWTEHVERLEQLLETMDE